MFDRGHICYNVIMNVLTQTHRHTRGSMSVSHILVLFVPFSLGKHIYLADAIYVEDFFHWFGPRNRPPRIDSFFFRIRLSQFHQLLIIGLYLKMNIIFGGSFVSASVISSM